MKFAASIIAVVLLAACSAGKKISIQPQAETISQLKFLSEYDVPYNFQFKGTTVGGLSGIDYDAANNLYYLICDDRSAINPARFYTAKVFIKDKGIDSVSFIDVKNLLQPNGDVYPNNKQDKAKTPDPEAIRYNPVTKQLIWTSEGERIVKKKDTVLANPALTGITTGGSYIDTFPLPANLLMHATPNGPRQNGVLEGLTFANNYKHIFTNVEEPLHEDGPSALLYDTTAWIRLFKYKVSDKKLLAEYAYKLDPVAYPSIPADSFKINGVPDILSISKNKLLVMERSFSIGRPACTIKVFETDISSATDIKGNSSLQMNTNFTPATKKLLLNMDALGIYIDNVEGMTFGPILPNGHKTLLFISDNNFDGKEKTQFLLFEIFP